MSIDRYYLCSRSNVDADIHAHKEVEASRPANASIAIVEMSLLTRKLMSESLAICSETL